MGIYQDIQKRTLIIDGAMGTMIQRHTLTEEDFRKQRFQDHPSPLKGNNDLLCITRPDIITDIHYAYLCAGADIIETNTFNAQRISMDDYGLTDCIEEVNSAAVKCAQAAVERYYQEHGTEQKKYIAGAVGPTSKTASLSPKVEDPSYRAVSFDDLVLAYDEQITAMLQTGVDAILIETIFDTLNAKAAFFAAQQAMSRLGLKAITAKNPNGDIALMASGTITDAAGRTLSGQTAAAFAISLSHIPLFSIGLNCALGADQLITYVKELESISDCFISAYPNAGLPNALGQYDQGANEMAEKVKPYLTGKHVQILGGCCGTTPDHIAAIAQLAQQLQSVTA
jgi:5-methyltetrahydrofolate--homocysteine methyltransferase